MKPRTVVLSALATAPAAAAFLLRHRVLESILFRPLRAVATTPAVYPRLAWTDVRFATRDGEQLHGFWVRALDGPASAHVLYCHGNGGNVGHRVGVAALLAQAGLDVLLFDYRGYGRSSGKPTEEGTYLDARAARAELLRQEGVDPRRVLYLGESLGGAVAVELATEEPPAGLVLQSAFTDVDSLVQVESPWIPGFLIPDAYTSLDRLPRVACPVLVMHGDRDTTVPLAQGRALAAVPGSPKELRVVAGADHHDVPTVMGEDYGRTIAEWARAITTASGAGARSPA